MMRIFNLSSHRMSLKALPVAAGVALAMGCALASPVFSRNNQPLGNSAGQTAPASVSGAVPVTGAFPSQTGGAATSSVKAGVSAVAPGLESGAASLTVESGASAISSGRESANVGSSLPSARALVLSNMEILAGGHLHHLSSRPRVFAPLKLKKHKESREERFLHLLFLVCALIGIFIAILALRSIPPASSKKES